MRNIIKKQEGITLIALVITIIVLLLLAGISITMLSGQDGILTKASAAKEATNESEEYDRVALTVQEVLVNGLGKIDLAKGSTKENSIEKALIDEFKNDSKKPTYEEGKITLSNGDKYIITTSGSIEKSTETDITWSYTDDTKSEVTDGKNKFKVGDEVTYTQQTETTTYTVLRSDSGRINNSDVTEDQTVLKKELTWIVIGVNEQAKLVLMSTDEANPVNIYGQTGGDNAKGIIDDMYNKFYGNSQKGTIAKGIENADMELFGYKCYFLARWKRNARSKCFGK